MRKLFAMMALMMLSTSAVMAAPRTKAQMKEAARQAISAQRSSRHLAPSNVPVKVLRSMEQIEVIGSEDGGFAVVAADDLLPAVLGVSAGHYSDGQNPNFEWWLQASAAAASQMVQRNAPLLVTKPDPEKYPEAVPSMVTTKWDQSDPYNRMCPTYNGTVKCLTGCVATAMAQVLNFHQTPAHGQGERTIYYPRGNHNGEAVTANYEEDYYDWPNMLDFYTYGSFNDEEANAVALLMRDCGVAADMEYGGPFDGSGAYSEDAAAGLREYFGFEEAQCLNRDDYSEPVWMDIIYRELSENGPLYYGGASWSSGGHAFVFDGYNADGMVSVNWGWSGDDDGYFYVSHLNPGYYDFNMQQDMIIGIQGGNHLLMRKENVTVENAGELKDLLEQNDEEGSYIGTLTVTGPLNLDDLNYLRHLAGWSVDGEPTGGLLRVLDLTNATLEENTLPEGIFKDCTSLRRVRLPETIAAIGANAFCGCKGLAELRVTTRTVPQLLGTGVFEGMPFGQATLYVRSGLKKTYLQTAQWSDFGENNILTVGTVLKVRNAIRKYGEKNPTFSFTASGDNANSVVGTPTFVCDATPTSPAGRYPVKMKSGSIENAEAYDFVDGYIIVQKVDAKAIVKDAERFEGEENPPFELKYEGLVAHDTQVAWLEEPVFKTTANVLSKPGVYTVGVKSATAESYNITFVSGKLTVKAKPVESAIVDLQPSTLNVQPSTFNLQGQRVQQQRKGLLIQDGKKVVR